MHLCSVKCLANNKLQIMPEAVVAHFEILHRPTNHFIS
jgi:hypothetical protein